MDVIQTSANCTQNLAKPPTPLCPATCNQFLASLTSALQSTTICGNLSTIEITTYLNKWQNTCQILTANNTGTCILAAPVDSQSCGYGPSQGDLVAGAQYCVGTPTDTCCGTLAPPGTYIDVGTNLTLADVGVPMPPFSSASPTNTSGGNSSWFTTERIIYVGAGGGGGLLLIIVVVATIVIVRRRRNLTGNGKELEISSPSGFNYNSSDLDSDAGVSAPSLYNRSNKSAFGTGTSGRYDYDIDKWANDAKSDPPKIQPPQKVAYNDASKRFNTNPYSDLPGSGNTRSTNNSDRKFNTDRPAGPRGPRERTPPGNNRSPAAGGRLPNNNPRYRTNSEDDDSRPPRSQAGGRRSPYGDDAASSTTYATTNTSQRRAGSRPRDRDGSPPNGSRRRGDPSPYNGSPNGTDGRRRAPPSESSGVDSRRRAGMLPSPDQVEMRQFGGSNVSNRRY